MKTIIIFLLKKSFSYLFWRRNRSGFVVFFLEFFKLDFPGTHNCIIEFPHLKLQKPWNKNNTIILIYKLVYSCLEGVKTKDKKLKSQKIKKKEREQTLKQKKIVIR